MTVTSAEDFPRVLASLFAAQDAAGLADLLAEDAQVLTLTAAWAEGRAEAAAAFAAEFAGIFAAARLVSGKTQLRPLGPGAAVLHQRFVVTGALQAPGVEMPRFPAMLSAVLVARSGGWQAVSFGFSALS